MKSGTGLMRGRIPARVDVELMWQAQILAVTCALPRLLESVQAIRQTALKSSGMHEVGLS